MNINNTNTNINININNIENLEHITPNDIIIDRKNKTTKNYTTINFNLASILPNSNLNIIYKIEINK